jgi:hypothetical protein
VATQQLCTIEELHIFGLPERATQGVAEETLNRLLLGRSAQVIGVLHARGYNFPLATWGDDTKSLVAKLTAYDVVFHGHGGNLDDNAAIVRSYEWANQQLRDVAAGRINLDVTSTEPARKRAGIARVFGNTKTGW